MTDTLYVNPWRFRAWSPRGLILGGMNGRTFPDGPALAPLHTNNEPMERRAAEKAGVGWLAEDRFLLGEPMPLDHAYAPEIGFLSLWPGSALDRLEQLHGASAAVLGVGGLGSQVAHLLAAAGVGSLVLCDRDVVELSNLNRQLYDTEELGRPKVEAAAARLRRLRPGIRIEALQRTVLTASDVEDAVRGVDIVVRAIDQPLLAQFEVNIACRRLGIPQVGGGFLETWAVAGPFVSADGPCLRCVTEPTDIELPPGPRKVPTFAPLTFWLSAQVGGDALRYLAGLGRPWTLERTLALDWATGEVREEALRPRPGVCPVCEADNPAPAVVTGPTPVRSGEGRRAAQAPPPGVVPALVGCCAVLAGLALLQLPLGPRLGVVVAGELLAAAAGVFAVRPRSVLNGYVWGAAWGIGVTVVGGAQLLLTSPAVMARPLTGVAAILLAVPIDAVLLSALGLAAAWAAGSQLRRRSTENG